VKEEAEIEKTGQLDHKQQVAVPCSLYEKLSSINHCKEKEAEDENI
jgi:hypothetical protein